MSEATRKRTVYLVLCHHWTYNDEYYTGEDEPVKAFSDRGKAEAYLERCEAEARLMRHHCEYTSVRFTVVPAEVEV